MQKIWKHRYQVIERIGKGGNGTVYKVWDLHLEKEWAMKILEERYQFSEHGNWEKNNNELQVLKKINHPNFPRIVDAFEEENKKVLIMDYIYGITLEDIIQKGPMTEEKILWFAGQIAEAILYLHQQNPVLLYLDLKPSNLMVDETEHLKIVDFGSVIQKGESGRISGSFGFASPEQMKVKKEGKLLTEQSDIFSFGMILYAMAVGNCYRIPIMESKDRYGIFVGKENQRISVKLEKIIEKCTRGKAERRFSGMREVKRELEQCGMLLKKKKSGILRRSRRWGKKRKQWYQEKSIFCTQGKHSFFIAGKFLVLPWAVTCFWIGNAIM